MNHARSISSAAFILGLFANTIPAMATDLGLPGTDWSGACTSQDGSSSQTVISFIPTEFISSTTYYGDAICKATAFKLDIIYSYEIGDDTTERAVYPFDRVISTITLTPKTLDQANLFNAIELCGLTTWELNKVAELGDKNCLGAAGDQSFDLISRKNTNDGTRLFFGLNSGARDGTSPAKRPSKIDRIHSYIKN